MIKTNMQSTSLDAYREIEANGKVGKQSSTILNHLSYGRDYSLQEISKITGYPINVVSGRVNDLKKMKLLTLGFKRPCSITGKTINPVKLPEQQERLF